MKCGTWIDTGCEQEITCEECCSCAKHCLCPKTPEEPKPEPEPKRWCVVFRFGPCHQVAMDAHRELMEATGYFGTVEEYGTNESVRIEDKEETL
jgi:hypothetical protein